MLIMKLAGAVLTFAVGLWLGLGAPGAKRRREGRQWDKNQRLRASWINRLFYQRADVPRRFDAGRLIVPKDESGDENEERGGGEEGGRKPPIVRLRR